MELSKSLPLVLVLSIAMGFHVIKGVEGSCTVQNNSEKKVIIVPVEVSVTIEVDVGALVSVPSSQQHCYFKNANSGHELGPVTLTDGTLVVIVDGAAAGTVDVHVATVVLGVLQLGVSILVSL